MRYTFGLFQGLLVVAVVQFTQSQQPLETDPLSKRSFIPLSRWNL